MSAPLDLYVILKLAHIVGAAVLFGTGAGIAFFMLMACRTRDAATIAHTAQTVHTADMLFTATAVLLQPFTGAALAYLVGYPLTESWIVASLGLYVMVGICWLPVVWVQIRLRDMAGEAARERLPLPATFETLFRIWFWLGWPAFLGVVAIFALMISKPVLW